MAVKFQHRLDRRHIVEAPVRVRSAAAALREFAEEQLTCSDCLNEFDCLTWELDEALLEVEEVVAALDERLRARDRVREIHIEKENQLRERFDRAKEQLRDRYTQLVIEDARRLASLDLDVIRDWPSGFFVYILWGESTTTPIYVGQSTSVVARIHTHMKDPMKSRLMRRVQLVRCPDKRAMDELELRLIKFYQPTLNRAGVSVNSFMATNPNPPDVTALIDEALAEARTLCLEVTERPTRATRVGKRPPERRRRRQSHERGHL